MKPALIAILLMGISCHAFAKNIKGGVQVPVATCSATAPSQASSQGLTNLVMCDTFLDTSKIDVYNQGTAGFDWYPQILNGGLSVTPPSYIVNSQSSVTLSGSGGAVGGPTNSGKTLQIAGPHLSGAPWYVGRLLSGSFYTELEMKFDPVTPSGQASGNAPAFWFQNADRYIANVTGGAVPSGVELDIFEALPQTAGTNIAFNSGFIHWNSGANGGGVDCSSGPGGNAPANYNVYNKFGALIVTAADGSGTGTISTYVNDVLSMSCTYNVSGVISCSTGGGGSCRAGTLYEMDTQNTVLMIGSGYYPWPEQVRNFHVWQKP